MSNGARHGLGVLAGIVAIPALSALLVFGTHRMIEQQHVNASTFKDGPLSDGLIVLALFAGGAVLLGLLCGSRLSPLASLVAGLPLAGYGAWWLVRPMSAIRNLSDLPGMKGSRGLELQFLAHSGLVLVIGLALVVASLPPSRWRSRAADDSLPFNGSTAAPRPVNDAWGAPPADPPMASRQEAPPLYGRQDAPAPPPPAASPGPGGGRHAAGGTNPKGGEWTQIYGGGGSS
ncbi:hypothetical protein [Actinomadura rupiterrae]|uniref:hypothetical protein n=1 Tax=Actinomadura rupiterrae TaxID=559627 RepID=UPI0020A28ED4|nr:hypothetical protein [Actinomadura rupiterrae]MCP2335378.1 hypothetical protein [Actinomadura rupiterrae]